ncbi:CPBP family intramembrane metalloprotease [Affinibrenneria salicis]|uniref:CPBP family intramembrane metalloprotease n=1 Tax=Affinibrenneria salicis TaxID=2590031 RepID=A0A5J5G183_9GAMM|nr:type II CAAX endopeptidase family protein [Affinibrenneria salicis]KAA8999487.1 CPBP family intramembrane metalloprotease [Affinibrenneria salicis]
MAAWEEVAAHKETKGFFSMFALMVLLSFVPLFLPNQQRLYQLGLMFPLLFIIEFSVIMPLYFYFFRKKEGLGKGRFNARLFCLLLVTILAIQFILPTLLGITKSEGWMRDQVSLHGWIFILSQFLLIVIVPVYEEVVFRGFLYGALKAWFANNVWWAAIVSSIMFTLLHTQYTDFRTLAILFLVALCFTVARVKSNGLLMPIALHITMNGLVFGMMIAITHYRA